jgi:hypothetical protein
MSERGVFAVDRGIFSHDCFADEPFTEREAWLWLIGEAAWKARSRRIGRVDVELGRGQLAASLRFLGEQWKWNKDKVDRFLARLRDRDMIETAAATGVTVISISNYDTYQKVALPGETAAATQSETETRQKRDNNKDIKNIKLPPSEPTVPSVERARATKPTVHSELETVLSPAIATAVIDHRRAIRANLTPHGAKLLARNLAARGDPDANANLMIERGWRGFKPEWADNDAKRNNPPQINGGRLSKSELLASGIFGVVQERSDDRERRGDDLRGSDADAGSAADFGGSGRIIEGRFSRIG